MSININDLSQPITRLEHFIAQSGSGGGGSLPEYTDADAGKVLGLLDQSGTISPTWVPGGLNVTISYDDGDFVMNSTYANIVAAVNSGVNVVVNVTPEDKVVYLHPSYYIENDTIVFCGYQAIITGSPEELEGLIYYEVDIASDDSLYVFFTEKYFT